MVVQIGDLFDQYSFSNFTKDPNKVPYNPQQEAEVGKQQADEMWRSIRKRNRKADLYQMPGNHDARLVSKFKASFPEGSFIGRDFMKRQMAFEGVKNIGDEFILDDIMFMHGMRTMGDHAKWNQMNTVTGHTHQARIQYYMNRHGIYWEFNTGWLGDNKAYPFAYRQQKKIDNMHHGIGLIEDRQPRFVLL